jgi:hypothetical protein
MATLLKVLNNLADIKSAGGVALRVRTQGRKGSVNLRTRVQRGLRKTIVVSKNGRPTRMVVAEVISNRLLESSMKGDLKSIQYVAQSDEDVPATETASQVEAGDTDLPDKDSLRLIARRIRDLIDEDE